MEFDVLVVGAGFGGLTAGLRCAELGLKVLILERGAEKSYLCNSRISGGHVTICMSDPAGSADDIATKVLEATKGTVSVDTAKDYASKAKPMIQWLRTKGLRFIRIGPDPARQWVLAPPRGGQAGLAWQGMGPDVALRQLVDAFDKAGGTICYDARATGLIMENGRCAGLQMDREGENRIVRGFAIVLADGGFQGDFAAVERYISATPAKVMQRNAGSATGDALRMAIQAGAKVVGMDRFYGHPLARDAFTNEQLWPHPYLDPMIVSGIVVGADGRRFVDEGKGPVHLTNVVARRPDPLDAVVIFDEEVWNGPAADITAPPAPNPTLKTRGATIHIGRTIEELAEKAGLPCGALVLAVSEFNNAIQSGTLDSIDPPRSSDRFSPKPILSAPFYAIPMCAGLTYTMGGPLVDQDARIMDEHGQPIPGLFAVGAA